MARGKCRCWINLTTDAGCGFAVLRRRRRTLDSGYLTRGICLFIISVVPLLKGRGRCPALQGSVYKGEA